MIAKLRLTSILALFLLVSPAVTHAADFAFTLGINTDGTLSQNLSTSVGLSSGGISTGYGGTPGVGQVCWGGYPSGSSFVFDSVATFLAGADFASNGMGGPGGCGSSKPDGLYWINIRSGSDNYVALVEISGGLYYATSTPSTDFSTHIITVTPANNTVTATSTTFGFGVTGYVSPSDFKDGMRVTVKYSNGGFESTQLVGPTFATIQQENASGEFTFPVTSSGAFSFSTTTNIQTIGNYDLITAITAPRYQVFGFNFLTTTYDSSRTYFIVSTSTAFGTLRQNVQHEADVFAGTASSTIDTSVCNPISGNFSLVPCVSVLFIPSGSAITQSVNYLHDAVLSKWPWGYVTRVAVIMTQPEASSSLPAFTANVDLRAGSSNTPDLESLSFDPQDMLEGGSDIVSSIEDTHGYGVTLWGLAEPIEKMLVALFVVVIIWHDLLGMAHRRKHT